MGEPDRLLSVPHRPYDLPCITRTRARGFYVRQSICTPPLRAQEQGTDSQPITPASQASARCAMGAHARGDRRTPAAGVSAAHTCTTLPPLCTIYITPQMLEAHSVAV